MWRISPGSQHVLMMKCDHKKKTLFNFLQHLPGDFHRRRMGIHPECIWSPKQSYATTSDHFVFWQISEVVLSGSSTTCRFLNVAFTDASMPPPTSPPRAEALTTLLPVYKTNIPQWKMISGHCSKNSAASLSSSLEEKCLPVHGPRPRILLLFRSAHRRERTHFSPSAASSSSVWVTMARVDVNTRHSTHRTSDTELTRTALRPLVAPLWREGAPGAACCKLHGNATGTPQGMMDRLKLQTHRRRDRTRGSSHVRCRHRTLCFCYETAWCLINLYFNINLFMFLVSKIIQKCTCCH